MLEVRLFGMGGLKYCSQSLPGFPGQLPHLLLSYLLLNRGRPQNREHVSAIFWGETTLQSSRKSLRNTLWRLRQSLQSVGVPVDEYISVDEDHLTFLCVKPYFLDIEAFEDATNSCLDIPGGELSQSQASALESAASLYTGDLLENIFEDWTLFNRERYRLIYQNLLYKLMVFHGVQGSYERGIDFGKRLINLDPTLEKVHRELMKLYWLFGDRSSAIGQYKLCRQILREELGVNPFPETEQLYEQILHTAYTAGKTSQYHSFSNLLREPLADSQTTLYDRIIGELQQLKQMIEGTQAESRLIEQLIQEVMAGDRI